MNTNGLTTKEVIESKKKYGTNIIAAKKNNSFIKLLLESLGDPIIKILIIALGIKIVFLLKDFDWYETIGIVIAIFIASFISSISEYGSEKAFIKLQEESSKIKCRVKRNGKIEEIFIEDVVVGDIVILEAGDKIPADGIIIEGDIYVDESSLNGEAKEIHKKPSIINETKESAIIFLTAHDECGYTVLKSCINFLTFISKFDDYEKRLGIAIKEAFKFLNVKKTLTFVEHNVTYNITVSNILYITKDTVNRKSVIVTDNNTHKTYMTISELLKKLSPMFVQSHRSCIVNKERIEKINKNKNIIIFDNGMKIDLLSDSYKKGLMKCG